MPVGEKVIQQSLVSPVPAPPLLHHPDERVKRLDARLSNHDARVERIGPSLIRCGGEGGGEVEEVRDGTEDERVGVEEDDFFVLGEAEEVQLGEGKGEISSTCLEKEREFSEICWAIDREGERSGSGEVNESAQPSCLLLLALVPAADQWTQSPSSHGVSPNLPRVRRVGRVGVKRRVRDGRRT